MPSKNVGHQLYAHLTWCTAERMCWIKGTTESALKEIIGNACAEMGYEILAMETVPDHVHLLVRFHPQHQLAQLVKTIKGRSSRLIARETGGFKWQEGYGVNTVGLKALEDAIHYVKNQKERHSDRFTDKP